MKKDKYGMPQLKISVDFDENDMKMLADFFTEYSAMFAAAGFENIQTVDTQRKPGNENHEMGGARMGHDGRQVGHLRGVVDQPARSSGWTAAWRGTRQPQRR